MENFEVPLPDENNEPTVPPAGEESVQLTGDEMSEPVPAEKPIPVLPKYEKPDAAANIWLRSFSSLAIYLILGYYFFPSYQILLLITAIVMIHELGHFFAMKYFRYNDLGIFFIPLLGAYVSGTKREVSQKQSAIILLAGPLPGMLIGIIFFLLQRNGADFYILDTPLEKAGELFIFLNLINLLPVYPLDGGQLLNRIFLDEENWMSKAFIFLSIAALGYFSWKIYSGSGSPFAFVFLLFPLMMVFRLFGEKKLNMIEKRVEEEGINTDLEYADLPDKDYWKIRNIIIEEHPSYKDVLPSPPYEYAVKEERIQALIQSLLHRHLIQDVSIVGKIIIFLIWAVGLASPWLLKIDITFLHRLGL
jgi:stage IV sporulation protein FB